MLNKMMPENQNLVFFYRLMNKIKLDHQLMALPTFGKQQPSD